MLRIREVIWVAAAAAMVAALAIPTAGWAGDGVQFSSDCNSTYVNKKVGSNEQWAITWDIFGDASGNVFKLDGSPPSFIECQLTGETDTDEVFDCFGASACTGPPCNGSVQWVLINSGVSIPTTFFLPPGVDPSDPSSSCTPK